MKTIVLSNLKQVFETIMTLCNILQLHVTSYNNKVVMYNDVFDENKVILLNKEYSEVFYHDFTNNIDICYEINNSEKLFVEYYNRCEKLNDEIKTMTNESIREIDYLNNRIETLKKEYRILDDSYAEICECNSNLLEKNEVLEKDTNILCEHISNLLEENQILEKEIEKIGNKLAYYETEYQDIVSEKLQQSENRYNHLLEIAQKQLEKKNGEIKQLTNIINDRDLVIETMKKQNDYLHKKIRKMNK